MNSEKDSELCKRYPQIFKDRSSNPRTTLMCFGFECGDGWFDLIDTLCRQISGHVNHLRRQNEDMTEERFYERYGVVAVQVKEKWGGLRFYVDGADEHVQGMIAMAEGMSYRICEVCGRPGVTRAGGWVRTLCDDHAA